MKIVKRILLLSFVSVLVVSQVYGVDNKKSADQISNLTAMSSEGTKEKHQNNTNPISDKLSVHQNTHSHLKANPKGAESKTPDKDYLIEIKDGLHKIFDLCLIIGGIALIFLTLKILYSLSKYIDSLTINHARKKPANTKPSEEIKG